jgi:peptidoglycan/xylan/chitin deacetylase (PgdA/CDA1 family)
MDNHVYGHSSIVSRPQVTWPDHAKVAFYIGVNIEHYILGRPGASIVSATAGLVPDPMNHGWRDYSPRVGVWRLMDLLDEVGLPASVLLNSDVCSQYPDIIAAGNQRGWVWLGHGKNNSTLQNGMDVDTERTYLTEMVGAVEEATGRSPTGWLGPGLTETFETPRLLRDLGFTYLLDWCCDDQPFHLKIPGMVSVPYTVELNDLTLFIGRNLSGPEFERIVEDQLEVLLAEGEQSGRVMTLALHPFVMNQPFRHKYLARALKRIAATDGVWMTTSDDIASYFLANHPHPLS